MDSNLVDQIVGEVVNRLRQRLNSAPALVSAPEPTPTTSRQPERQVEIPDAVITGESLKHLQQGLTVQIGAKAILTPSARDFVQMQGIQIVRENPAERTSPSSSDRRGTIIASHITNVVRSVMDDVRRKGNSNWSVEMESGLEPVVERTRSIICRGEAKHVVVFARAAQAVACWVNRNHQCRAAVVRNREDVRAARADLGANVLCVDLQQASFIQLRELVRTSAATIDQIREPDWRMI